MLGMFFRHQPLEIVEAAAFGLHLVDEAGKLARERRCLTRGQRPGALSAAPMQHQGS